MSVETKYIHERTWQTTSERDLLRIITEEVGDVDPKGILVYVKEVIKTGKEITVGSCKFREGK